MGRSLGRRAPLTVPDLAPDHQCVHALCVRPMDGPAVVILYSVYVYPAGADSHFVLPRLAFRSLDRLLLCWCSFDMGCTDDASAS